MTLWRPDPSFYPSARMAMEAPPERVAYVAALNYGRNDRPDEIRVVDVDPASPRYGQVINALALSHAGDELHHFGWSACSSALCPNAPHPHLERRYLVVPGIRSSAYLHHRHQARSDAAEHREGDRTRGDVSSGRATAARTPCTAGRTRSTSVR